jgi:hypothetical protein
MALFAALPLGPGILWRGFDRCRASLEGIESASGASSSAFCFPGESERLIGIALRKASHRRIISIFIS